MRRRPRPDTYRLSAEFCLAMPQDGARQAQQFVYSYVWNFLPFARKRIGPNNS